jgi:Family of unknown function (DUF6081)
MRFPSTLLTILTALAVSSSTGAARADAGYPIFWDDFRSPWDTDPQWLPFIYGTYDADDGCGVSTDRGLMVTSCGVNPTTGLPAFRNTLDHLSGPLAPMDHAKWIVLMNHFSTSGAVGFDAVAGQELGCEAVISGQVFGTEAQPFGDAVMDPRADLRLGSVAISAFDADTFVIFNFVLTNELVYAFYERPAFARAPGTYDAAFQFAVPVMRRSPGDTHRLAITYDRAAGTARWLIEGIEVFRVDAIGSRLPDRSHMLIDHGGYDVIVSPAQMDCAMAIFDFLDGYGPTGRGLVQIDPDPDDYFDPRLGSPARMTFVDPESLSTSRLFGQGAAMTVERFEMWSRPTGPR